MVLSRADDSNLSMLQRKKTFREADIDLMVSIHNNAGGSPLVPAFALPAAAQEEEAAVGFLRVLLA